ncbi:MAG TPA: hypothetical protein VIU64_07155, partial [Polyangia bacterium]
MQHSRMTVFVASALLAAAAVPVVLARRDAARAAAFLDGITAAGDRAEVDDSPGEVAEALDPALLVRVHDLEPLLASWQTVGGCGAGAGAGSGAG